MITQPVLSGTAAPLWLWYFWSLHAVKEGPPMDTGMQPAAKGDSVALPAAQWLSVHSPGCADSSWDSFRRMAALLSYDSTCPTSSQVGMLAQDQYWQLAILQKKTPIFPHPDFHIDSHWWPFIDTVRWGWISGVVYGLNHAEGWTLGLSSGSMGQWTEDPVIFLLEFKSKQSS